MRLQVEILRHTLPPVNIIFNTRSSRNPVRTVSELLAALDQIVPLESNDGEWGLEDYLVEVAACSDQTNLYECLHYQFIKDVFREDDEVIVRGLTTDELRERRQGGRVQISLDGRHLIDGVAWGRRYNARSLRPGITIPPRKRRRILPPDQDVVGEEDLLQLGYGDATPEIGTVIDDEDDVNDDEYLDGDLDSESSESDIEPVLDGGPLQIVTKQLFEDADADADANSDMESSNSGSEVGDIPIGEIEDDEVQLLLKEAGELEEAYLSLPLEDRITSPSSESKRLKRKRSQTDAQDTVFEGFSTPIEQSQSEISPQEQVNGNVQGAIGGHVVTSPAANSKAKLKHAITSATTNGITTRPSPQAPQSKRLESENDDDDDDTSDESSSSSEESESESGSGSSSGGDSSDYDSESDSDVSSSDTESTSNSDDTSSSGESESESESETENTIISSKLAPSLVATPNKLDSEPNIKLRLDNPPGSGTKRTRANNNRAKLRKRLLQLKEQGLLPPEADFEALKAYEAGQEPLDDADNKNEGTSSLDNQLNQRKEEMLARLSSVYESGTANVKSATGDGQAEIKDSQPASKPEAATEVPESNHPSTTTPHTTARTPSTRARLDVESSRRMLFSSLGLRNPKTPEAEQALRDKLSQPVRKIIPRQSEQEVVQSQADQDDDSWKEKLIISAVECVQEGVLLTPPPFPFKQRWDKGVPQKKARLSAQYYQQPGETEVAQYSIPAAASPRPEVSIALPESRTVSAGTADKDNISCPADVESYPPLSQQDVRVDAVVAYKELHLNDKFEPEESPYRVARIVAINEDMIDLILSKQDKARATSASFDEETGERVYNKFEMPLDENHLGDDGLREITFGNMIAPKLVQAAKVQVPDSQQALPMNETQSQEGIDLVPDSGPAQIQTSMDIHVSHVDIATPRRDEISNIIKDAGFNAALDKQLLQPINLPKSYRSPLKEPTNAWESSPFEPDAANDTSQSRDQAGSSPRANTSSPPTISMVETVDYPHVSQIDINQSSLGDPTASSSHQDAQRVSPGVSDIEYSSLSHLRVRKPRLEESQASSLSSEVPFSQPVGALDGNHEGGAPQIDVQTSVSLQSNAYEEIDRELDLDEIDSDGLPSLRSLTSSQRQRKNVRSSNSGTSPEPSLRISPPRVRRRNMDSSRSTAAVVEEANENNVTGPAAIVAAAIPITQDPDPEQVKVSVSQQPAISLSQVPADTSIVDLTVSSDPVEPSDNHEDGDYNNDDDEDYDTPRARRRAARKNKGDSSQSQSQSRRDSQGGAAAGRAMRSAFAGLGARRNLSGKSRSQV